MSGGKETGRQKMIGMMYLVLTALLAMNISKDVLLAFVTVENGLNQTNKNFDAKNSQSYLLFEQEVANDPIKAKPLQAKALAIKAAADSLCQYIDFCRGSFVHQAMGGAVDGTGGLITRDSANTHPMAKTEGTDNYDIPTNTLIGADVHKPDGLAVALKEKVRAFRALCFETVKSLNDTAELNKLQIGLNTNKVYDADHEDSVSWEVSNFNHTTIAAAASLLAGVKNETKTAESDVVNILLKQITGDIVRFDRVVAKVVAPSSYILSGQEYKADLFVAAYSTTVDPIIRVGGSTIKVEEGMGKYVVRTNATGLQTFKGSIDVKQPDGTFKNYPFEQDYMVAKPSMAVSPTKMNVFYIGVDNPVDISVAGASPTDVMPSIVPAGNGSISAVPGSPGKYIVKVKSGDKCEVAVNIKKKEGGTTSMGSMPFRIRRVPSPTASFAGIIGDGKVTKGQLAAAAGVIPKLEDFVFDLNFPVVSWTMSMNVNGVFVDLKATGPGTTPEMKSLMEKAKPGGKILIEEVKVKGPAGDTRSIVGCVIKVK
jgi:gliding motility-associated protein GldM